MSEENHKNKERESSSSSDSVENIEGFDSNKYNLKMQYLISPSDSTLRGRLLSGSEDSFNN